MQTVLSAYPAESENRSQTSDIDVVATGLVAVLNGAFGSDLSVIPVTPPARERFRSSLSADGSASSGVRQLATTRILFNILT